jgi:hypothetical protein
MKISYSTYTTGIVISRRLLTGGRSFMNTITTAFEYRTLDLKSNATKLGVCEKVFQQRVRRKLLLKLPGFAAHGISIVVSDGRLTVGVPRSVRYFATGKPIKLSEHEQF